MEIGKIALMAAALAASSVASASDAPLMKKFSDEFDPITNTGDFIQACRIAQAFKSQKLSDEQSAVGLTCLGIFAGVAGVFDGSPRFTLDDGHTTVAVCPKGKNTYGDMVTLALELADSGEIDPAKVTPAHLALAAVLRAQACQSS